MLKAISDVHEYIESTLTTTSCKLFFGFFPHISGLLGIYLLEICVISLYPFYLNQNNNNNNFLSDCIGAVNWTHIFATIYGP